MIVKPRIDSSSNTPTVSPTIDSPSIERLENRFSEAMDMIRDLAMGINTATTVSSDLKSANVDELKSLEGAWKFSSGSHAYAKVIDGDLRVPYSYKSNEHLVGEYFGWTRTGGYWLCKFKWFNRPINGVGLYRKVSTDMLEGTWWGNNYDLEDILNNISSFKRGTHLTWHRRHEFGIPSWASEHWDSLLKKPNS